MASFAFVLPILPGKEEADVQGFEHLMNDEQGDAFGDWHRSLGFRRHAVWHQRTPDGTVAVVLFEADDIESALRGAATSDDPFAQRFRQFVQDVHGIDLATAPPPDVRPVIDWRP